MERKECTRCHVNLPINANFEKKRSEFYYQLCNQCREKTRNIKQCGCGVMVSVGGKGQHENTVNHTNYMLQKLKINENNRCSKCFESKPFCEFNVKKHGDYTKTCSHCIKYMKERAAFRYTCECGVTLRKNSRRKHVKTQMHINNTKKLNNDITTGINEYATIQYTCECGLTLRKDGKHKHVKSQRHIKAIEKLSDVTIES
jgi:hypothetical protein